MCIYIYIYVYVLLKTPAAIDRRPVLPRFCRHGSVQFLRIKTKHHTGLMMFIIENQASLQTDHHWKPIIVANRS